MAIIIIVITIIIIIIIVIIIIMIIIIGVFIRNNKTHCLQVRHAMRVHLIMNLLFD